MDAQTIETLKAKSADLRQRLSAMRAAENPNTHSSDAYMRRLHSLALGMAADLPVVLNALDRLLSGGVERAGTCATCRHALKGEPKTKGFPSVVADDDLARVIFSVEGARRCFWLSTVPESVNGEPFGCTLYQPALPPPPEAERARREP